MTTRELLSAIINDDITAVVLNYTKEREVTNMNQAEMELRKKILRAMHEYMSEYQPYKEAYDRWITVAMPDEPDESDFQFMAEDDKIFAETCGIFGEIVKWIEQEEKEE